MVAAAVHVNVETSLLKFAVRQKKDYYNERKWRAYIQELILHENYRRHHRR